MSIDINHFHVLSGHLNERLLRETAQQAPARRPWAGPSLDRVRRQRLDVDAAVRDKEEVEDHLVYVRTFVADMNNMGRPQCFRTDNGGEFSSRDYVEFSDSTRICREYTAPGRPQQNAVFKSAILRAIEGGHAARREIRLMFPGVDLGRIPNIYGQR